MPEFAVRHAGEHVVHGGLPAQPGKVSKVLAHALRTGPGRVGFHLVPAGSVGAFGYHEQGGQALVCLERQRGRDATVIGAVDQGAGGAGELEERTEGGQFAALAQQFLDAGVDDVGQVVARARRLDAGPRRNAPSVTVVASHADVAAHQGREADAVGRVAIPDEFTRVARQPRSCSDVADDSRRHVGQPDDAPEVLESLEQDQE